jgi:hypothetical protein
MRGEVVLQLQALSFITSKNQVGGGLKSERLNGNEEYSDVMRKLKQACDEDKSGRYQRILSQSGERKVAH